MLCAKSTFFSLSGNRTSEARAMCGFQYHKGENLFCFLFSDSVIVGLENQSSKMIAVSTSFPRVSKELNTLF